MPETTPLAACNAGAAHGHSEAHVIGKPAKRVSVTVYWQSAPLAKRHIVDGGVILELNGLNVMGGAAIERCRPFFRMTPRSERGLTGRCANPALRRSLNIAKRRLSNCLCS